MRGTRPVIDKPEDPVQRIAVEPGLRLADRYRIEEKLSENDGASAWRAQDEVLHRDVVAHILAEDHPRADAMIAAARAAAAMTDSRFVRVLDASRRDGLVYVVIEWVTARSLTTLLADGPMHPDDAQALALDVASALAAAHTMGLPHLRMRPSSVLRTEGGQTKIVGLAVDVAVLGVPPEHPQPGPPAERDAQGVGRVLYAALTGLWPGELGDGLPPAPADSEGCYRSPRQVRAGIPGHLDDLCRRLLAPRRAPEDTTLRTPADVAAALADSHGSAASHVPVPPPLRRREQTHGSLDTTRDIPTAGPVSTGRALRLLRAVVILLVAVGLGLALWQLAIGAIRGPQSSEPASRAQAASGGRPSAAPDSGAVLKVATAEDFDPPPAGNGEENGEEAALAVDGDPATSWQTQTYFDALELQKPGIGLILDLGSAQQVGSVHLRLVGQGTDVELRAAAREAKAPPAHLGGFDRVTEQTTAGSSITLRPKDPVATRYLLVWLTKLPAVGSDYRGGIAEAVVHAP